MTTLGAWLKTQGFTVDDNDVPLGRQSTWSNVKYLMVHHTASPDTGSEYGIAKYVRTGGTYPPLAQIMLGQSGKVWMTCQERGGQKDPGRASHAGNGSGFGVARDTMNSHALGIECQCDGTHKLAKHVRLYSVLIDLLAALSRHYRVPVANIIGHKEWSNTGKVDPRDDMSVIRAAVAKKLEGSVSTSDGFLSLKETDVRKVKTNTDVLIDIDGKTRWTPETPGGRHTLAMYVNLNLPPSGSEERKAINRGGVRYWFQQYEVAEDDKRDETGYTGPHPPPVFGDQYFLYSHVWPHTADRDYWEFAFRVYAFDANGKEVSIELELRTREIKIIADKT